MHFFLICCLYISFNIHQELFEAIFLSMLKIACLLGVFVYFCQALLYCVENNVILILCLFSGELPLFVFVKYLTN